MRKHILAAALAVAASLATIATPAAAFLAAATPATAVTPHGVPARQGGVSTLSVNPAYYYAGGQETPAATKTTLGFNVYVADPAVQAGDHSLAEFTVQAGTSYRQAIIEFGWVDDTSHSGHPYLFASRWVNNAWGGSYVGVGDGWFDASGNCVNLGVDLTAVPVCGSSPQTYTNDVGGGRALSVQYDSGTACNGGAGWWYYYKGSGIGCYPTSIWSSASPSYSFAAGQFFQAFGEVYDDDTTVNPCTDMGTATHGSTKALPAAYFGSGSYNGAVTNMSWTVQTNASWYTIGGVSGRTAYFGGPGAC